MSYKSKIFKLFERSKTRKSTSVERRGKPTTQFKLGSTKNPNVVKIILESLLMNPMLNHLKSNIDPRSIKDPRYTNKIFNQLIKVLEEG